MEFSDGDESSRIGLSANNVFSSGTDTDLAYQLVLARVGHVLKSPKHSRESMVEFKKDWNLLQSVRSNRAQRFRQGCARLRPRRHELGHRIIPRPARAQNISYLVQSNSTPAAACPLRPFGSSLRPLR